LIPSGSAMSSGRRSPACSRYYPPASGTKAAATRTYARLCRRGRSVCQDSHCGSCSSGLVNPRPRPPAPPTDGTGNSCRFDDICGSRQRAARYIAGKAPERRRKRREERPARRRMGGLANPMAGITARPGRVTDGACSRGREIGPRVGRGQLTPIARRRASWGG
jgi:hypothetical protein